MKIGSRNVSREHVIDLIVNSFVGAWQNRRAIDWSIIARRMVKLAILTLTIIAMVYVLYPTQRQGWALWLGTDTLWKRELGHWTAVSLVGFTAIVIPAFRYAWEHGHKILASLASFFAVALLTTVLMGTWNYYSYSSSRAVATSLAATGGTADRIADAARRMSQIDAEAKQAAARFDAELARTPANYATARSRILRAQTEARQAAATERAALQVELREARAQNVTVNTTIADPRPIDQFISNTLRTERTGTGIALDLWRSLVFELAALIGVALSTTAVAGVAAAARDARVIYKYGHQPLGDDRAIEDQRAKPKIRKEPFVSTRERIIDAETGEELIEVPGYRRRKGKAKPGDPQPATIETPPISLPDETGVQLEADSRVARELPPNVIVTPPAIREKSGDEYGPQEYAEHQYSEFSEAQDSPSLFGEPPAYDSEYPQELNEQHERSAVAGAGEADVAAPAEMSGERQDQYRAAEMNHDLTDEELALLAEDELEKA